MKTQESINRFYNWLFDGVDETKVTGFQLLEDLPHVSMPITPEEELIQEGINEEGYEEAMRNINDKS